MGQASMRLGIVSTDRAALARWLGHWSARGRDVVVISSLADANAAALDGVGAWIVDLSTPNLSADDALAALKARQAGGLILFITADPNEADTLAGRLDGALPVPRPLDLAFVDDLLDAAENPIGAPTADEPDAARSEGSDE